MANGRLIPVAIRALQDDDKKPEFPPQSSDVLYDAHGEAFHRTCVMGVRPHDHAHQLDPATFVRVRRNRDQVIWIADGTLEVLGFEFIGPRDPSKPTGHPGHHQHVTAVAGTGTTAFINLFPKLKLVADAEFDRRVVVSGTTEPGVPLGFYKATFRLNGNLTIDPDLEITP